MNGGAAPRCSAAPSHEELVCPPQARARLQLQRIHGRAGTALLDARRMVPSLRRGRTFADHWERFLPTLRAQARVRLRSRPPAAVPSPNARASRPALRPPALAPTSLSTVRIPAQQRYLPSRAQSTPPLPRRSDERVGYVRQAEKREVRYVPSCHRVRSRLPLHPDPQKRARRQDTAAALDSRLQWQRARALKPPQHPWLQRAAIFAGAEVNDAATPSFCP